MRNLKKVLSLALALVMMLGMMTFASAAETKITAKDLTDMDEVSKTEAVTLLVDLGVIAGIKQDDGSYKYAPTEGINRSSFSKMVYFTLMGNADGSENFVGTSALKDIAGNWAEGFIAYLASLGIVAGDESGYYKPDDGVTVVQACKMLLVAMGYDAKDRGYENDALWSTNIMSDAKSAGLLKSVDQVATEALDRDNAAQLIYNTLFANVRTPNYDRDMGEKYIKDYTTEPYTLGLDTFGLVKYVVTVNALTPSVTVASATPKATANAALKVKTAVEKSSDLKFTPEMLATNVTVYAKVAYETSADGKTLETYNFKSLYSTTLGAAETTVLGTSTNGTAITGFDPDVSSSKDLTTKHSKNKGYIASIEEDEENDGEYKVAYFLDGEAPSAAGGDLTIASFAVPTAIATAAAKKGAVVDLIDTNDNGTIDIIKVTVKKVATLTADVTTRGTGDELEVKVPGVTGLSVWTEGKKVAGYEGLKKNDVVLYTSANGVTYIEKAKFVDGVATAIKGGEVKVDGEFYGPSGLVSDPLSGWDDYKNTYKFYLDDNNTVIKTVKVTNETADEYAVLLSTGWAGSSSELGGTSYGQAKLMYTDGTTEIVKVAKINDTTVTSANATDSTFDAKKLTFMTYTVNDDDEYELKDATQTAIHSGGKITNNAKKFDTNSIGNDATVFLVHTKDGTKDVFKTYTGIASVPTMTDISGTVLLKDSIATYVYVNATGEDASIEGIDSDALHVYIPDNTDFVKYAKAGDVPAYYEYTAYVNGAEDTIKTSGLLATDDAVYKLSTQNEHGHYAPTTAIADSAFELGYPIANGGTLSVNNVSDLYSYDSDSNIYVIAADKTLTQIASSELKADATNKIYVVADTDKYATTIFIREIVGTTATATIKNGDADVVTSGSAGAFTGSTTAAKGTVVKLAVTTANDATYTIDKASVTVGDTAQTVVITVTSEDGTASATYTITVSKV